MRRMAISLLNQETSTKRSLRQKLNGQLWTASICFRYLLLPYLHSSTIFLALTLQEHKKNNCDLCILSVVLHSGRM